MPPRRRPSSVEIGDLLVKRKTTAIPSKCWIVGAGTVVISVTVARTIRDSFQEPFKVGAVAVQVSLSIGVGVFPDDGDTSDLLLKISDQAMYRVKEKGRDGFRFHVEPAEV